MTNQLLTDLARVKALFQARAIAAAMGIEPDEVEMEPQVNEPHSRKEIE